MKNLLSKNSVMLSVLAVSMALGTGHSSFASNPKSLLETLPKDVQGEIEKHTNYLNELNRKVVPSKILYASDLTKDNVYSFEAFRGLTLNIDRVDDETMKLVSKLTHIKSIQVNGSVEKKFTDATLAYLKDIKGVEFLYLANTKITDNGLVHLKNIDSPYLSMSLSNTDITDAGIVHLKELKRLDSVFLNGTKVTDSGIAELRKRFHYARITKQ